MPILQCLPFELVFPVRHFSLLFITFLLSDTMFAFFFFVNGLMSFCFPG